jgi:cytochrome P450
MDPPQHTSFRALVEQFFTSDRMATFEPTCSALAERLVDRVARSPNVEIMTALALPLAAEAQCRFLGWPPQLAEPLIQWTQRNAVATFRQERSALEELAREFDVLVDEQLDARQGFTGGASDITRELCHQRVDGRSLSRAEIASILRNWTAGEIGSLAAAVGILVQFLAEDWELQQRLRGDVSLLGEAIDEILRLHAPLAANRRVATREVTLQGRTIPAGQQISLMWSAANRDGRVFDDPTNFRFGRDPQKNLLYGAGIHACPGAPLARLELRLVMEALLTRTSEIRRAWDKPPVHATYPMSGYAELYITCRPAAA